MEAMSSMLQKLIPVQARENEVSDGRESKEKGEPVDGEVSSESESEKSTASGEEDHSEFGDGRKSDDPEKHPVDDNEDKDDNEDHGDDDIVDDDVYLDHDSHDDDTNDTCYCPEFFDDIIEPVAYVASSSFEAKLFKAHQNCLDRMTNCFKDCKREDRVVTDDSGVVWVAPDGKL